MKKRYLAVLLAAGMVLSMAGCGSKDKEKDNSEKTSQTSENGTETSDDSEEGDESEGDESKGDESDNSNLINPADPTVAIEMQDELESYVKLGKYEGMEYGVYSTEVNDKEVEDELRAQCASNGYFEKVDRAAQNGDFVYVTFKGTIDGKEDDNLSNGEQELPLELGSDSFIEGFEDGLVGHKAGEKVVLDLTFPKDYNNPDYASKKAQFTVDIKSVNIIPEFTDEFIASTFGKQEDDSASGEEGTESTEDKWKTVKQAKDSIKATLKEKKETNKENYKMQDIVSKLIDEAEYKELPKEYVEEYYQTSINDYKTYASYYSMEIEDFVEAYFGVSYDKFEEQTRAYAEECVREDLAMWAIAQQQNIQLTDEEYEKRTNELFESYKSSYNYEDVSQFIENNGGEDTVKYRLRLILAREWLVEHAKEGKTYTDREEYTKTLPWYNKEEK